MDKNAKVKHFLYISHMAIMVFNKCKESHIGENVFPIYRGTVLGNPFTHIKDRQTKASYIVKDRDEAIDQYSHYFDVMYGSNLEFTKAIDGIYEAYKSGEDVYLECYCHPLRCHGDIIVEKLRKRLIKEMINGRKEEQNISEKRMA